MLRSGKRYFMSDVKIHEIKTPRVTVFHQLQRTTIATQSVTLDKVLPGEGRESQRARNMCKTITCEPTGSLGDNQDPWLRLSVDGYTAGSSHGSVPWKSSAVAKGEAISQQR